MPLGFCCLCIDLTARAIAQEIVSHGFEVVGEPMIPKELIYKRSRIACAKRIQTMWS